MLLHSLTWRVYSLIYFFQRFAVLSLRLPLINKMQVSGRLKLPMCKCTQSAHTHSAVVLYARFRGKDLANVIRFGEALLYIYYLETLVTWNCFSQSLGCFCPPLEVEAYQVVEMPSNFGGLPEISWVPLTKVVITLSFNWLYVPYLRIQNQHGSTVAHLITSHYGWRLCVTAPTNHR